MQPLTVCLWICAATIAATWIASLITREYSWVDRIWSIVPVVYVWVFAVASGQARVLVMAVLVTLWGARLTFNFARKGGYARGGEDYRWAVLRGRMSPTAFQFFNLFFISGYQNALILFITLPAFTVYTAGGEGLGGWDALLVAAFLAFLVGETVADQQQWAFHRRKRAEAAAGRTVSPGFATTGLFRFSRHPNFFFEQAQWWTFALFGVVATGTLWNWTMLAPLLLTVLCLGSTAFTESISRSRHPEYAQYQARTSALIPWFPKRAETAAATRRT
jgi:steroid 5-alpha reductase family enzyme